MTYTTKIQQVAKKYLSLETEKKHTWCSGCGNYGILNAVMSAVALEGYEPHEIVLANDVGCNGNVSDKIETNTIHGLHGRVLPLASGVHLANPAMPVIAMAGDGATLSEGVNHLIHTARNNYDITFILHNNHNYGLTTGQASSTTPKGVSMKATPGEVTATPLVPAQLVLSSGGTFVARGYSGNVEQLIELIRAGMNHKGFSFIEVMQLCPTYSKATPADWFEQRVYNISENKEYNIHDKYACMQLVADMDHIATGILYHDAVSKSFLDLQTHRASRSTAPRDEVTHFDLSLLLKAFIV